MDRATRGAAGVVLVCVASVAHSQPLHEAVRAAAAVGGDVVVMIAGRPAEVIYAGESNGCAQVAVQRQRSSQQNFEVCDGVVRDKFSVAPSWPVNSSVRQMLSMVVDQALRQGRSVAQDSNGYTIAARRQYDAGPCSTIMVTVTYNGDLVDRAVRQVCGQGHSATD